MWINAKSYKALSEYNGTTFIFCRLLHISWFERFASANLVPRDSVGENSVNFCFVRSNYMFPISNCPILIFFGKWQMKFDIFLRQHWLLLSFNSFKISFFIIKILRVVHLFIRIPVVSIILQLYWYMKHYQMW